jgi:hypothetical protein
MNNVAGVACEETSGNTREKEKAQVSGFKQLTRACVDREGERVVRSTRGGTYRDGGERGFTRVCGSVHGSSTSRGARTCGDAAEGRHGQADASEGSRERHDVFSRASKYGVLHVARTTTSTGADLSEWDEFTA